MRTAAITPETRSGGYVRHGYVDSHLPDRGMVITTAAAVVAMDDDMSRPYYVFCPSGERLQWQDFSVQDCEEAVHYYEAAWQRALIELFILFDGNV